MERKTNSGERNQERSGGLYLKFRVQGCESSGVSRGNDVVIAVNKVSLIPWLQCS
jgi:hypothetical protein